MASNFSLASFSKETSCGYLIFAGAQVASRIKVPSFSGPSSTQTSDDEVPPPEGGFERSSSSCFLFRASNMYSLASAIMRARILLRNSTSMLASNGGVIPRQPDKILQIWVFCDLLNQFPVWILELCLYDQSAKCCTKRLCNISSLYFKKPGILLFKNIPRDGISHLDPAVIRIHMKPQWLIEIQERKM